MKKLLISSCIVAILAAVLYLPAGADEDSINATVSPLVLSVVVTPDSVDYGTLSLSPADNDRTRAKSPTITADNTGSNAVLMIRGSDATTAVAGNTNWTLDCSGAAGAVGQDQYVHRAMLGDQPNFDLGSFTLCNSGSKELSPVAAGGGIEFTLEIAMPTSTSGTAERSTTVTVIAVAP